MDRESLEGRLVFLQQERQRLAEALVRLNGGILELEWLLSQEVEAAEAEEGGEDDVIATG